MSLDKAIEHGKEKRRQYRGGKAISCSCRNHGTCDWCRENRLINKLRREEAMEQEEKEWENMERYFTIKCPFCGRETRVSNGWKYCMFTQQCDECEEVYEVEYGEVVTH